MCSSTRRWRSARDITRRRPSCCRPYWPPTFTGRSVLDMGCGTAVLAILAGMKGASPVVAVDIDEFATENAVENVRLNRSCPTSRCAWVVSRRTEAGDLRLYLRQHQPQHPAGRHARLRQHDMKSGSRSVHERILCGRHSGDPGPRPSGLGLRLAGHAEKNRWARVECVKD